MIVRLKITSDILAGMFVCLCESSMAAAPWVNGTL